jgi:hypothetical protein
MTVRTCSNGVGVVPDVFTVTVPSTLASRAPSPRVQVDWRPGH